MIVQSAFRNDRKQHMINESVEPNLLRYPLHYNLWISWLNSGGRVSPLVDFELPAEEAIQLLYPYVSRLLEPKE